MSSSNWPEARIQAEAVQQAVAFIGALRSIRGQIPGMAVNYGLSREEVDEFLYTLDSPEGSAQLQAVLVPNLAQGLRAGRALNRYYTQDEVVPAPADVYDDPEALARILRDTFPAFRDKICAAG